jgi:hypothetical protein
MLMPQGFVGLEHAAAYLMTEINIAVTISLEGKSRIVQMRARLRKAGVAVVNQAATTGEIDLNLAFRMLMQWLAAEYFPNHRAALVPADLRRHGVSMAGHDTPAAGWLFPKADSAETDADSIIYHGRRYTSRWFHNHPGLSLKCRKFPVYLPAPEDEEVEEGIFVEVGERDSIALYYLTEQR